MDEVDAVVVGAGVVGLALARALACAGREVLILEAAARFGTGASSRNSEVIHAGIYYVPGSLKARLCVAGREELYAYCTERGIAHRRCGKLIVAASAAQEPELGRLAHAARANGVELEPLGGAAARALEPQLACAAALHSPLTGIIDSHAYMLALLADAQAQGAILACGSALTRAVLETSGVALGVNGAAPALRARVLVNCAGVQAPQVARLIEGFPAAHVPQAYFARGNYFTLTARAPFQRLIYPLPADGGLGIHLTLDLAGRARFGPDVQWIDACDCAVDASRAAGFYGAIRRYWPALPDGALAPAYAGVRAKITAPGEPPADFRIDSAPHHGVAAVINLFGIESPGLTASLAIAREVVSRLD
jgi:L-2-hydroxyglutarate oxidase LhgO